MAFDITRINSGPSKDPLSILLTAKSGFGKTSFAASFPNPIGIMTEDGKGDLDFKSFDIVESYDNIISCIRYLLDTDHDHKTVIVDTIDGVEPLIFKKVVDNYNANSKKEVKTHSEIPHGQGWTQAIDLWRFILAGLEKLRTEKKMTVILLAQCLVKKIELPDLEPYDQYVLGINDKASLLIRSWCQVVFFGTYKIYTYESDSKKTKATGTSERVIYTEERPTHFGKHRHGLPFEFTVPKTGQYELLQKLLNKKESKKNDA